MIVIIEDGTGKKVAVEVKEEIYDLYQDEERANERDRYYKRHHLDGRDITDDSLAGQLISDIQDIETQFFTRELLRNVEKILQSCSPLQRERFCLNRIYGYSYIEIAEMQGCHFSSVKESVDAVIKKLKFLKRNP